MISSSRSESFHLLGIHHRIVACAHLMAPGASLQTLTCMMTFRHMARRVLRAFLGEGVSYWPFQLLPGQLSFIACSSSVTTGRAHRGLRQVCNGAVLHQRRLHGPAAWPTCSQSRCSEAAGAPQHGRMPAEAEGLAGGRLELQPGGVHAGAELIICRKASIVQSA